MKNFLVYNWNSQLLNFVVNCRKEKIFSEVRPIPLNANIF